MEQAQKENEAANKLPYFSGGDLEKPEGWDDWTPARQSYYKKTKKEWIIRNVLEPAGYRFQQEKADGACMFRSAADAMEPGSSNRDHLQIRNDVIDWIEEETK